MNNLNPPVQYSDHAMLVNDYLCIYIPISDDTIRGPEGECTSGGYNKGRKGLHLVKTCEGRGGQAKICGRYADLVGTKKACLHIFSMVLHIFFHDA